MSRKDSSREALVLGIGDYWLEWSAEQKTQAMHEAVFCKYSLKKTTDLTNLMQVLCVYM